MKIDELRIVQSRTFHVYLKVVLQLVLSYTVFPLNHSLCLTGLVGQKEMHENHKKYTKDVVQMMLHFSGRRHNGD